MPTSAGRSADRQIDKLCAKVDDAERRYDLAMVSDLGSYAIPDLQKKLEQLEACKATAEGETVGMDIVTSEVIVEIVRRWMGIPVTRLVATEEKLLKMKIISETVMGQPEAVKAV